jgi:hypothetical protein
VLRSICSKKHLLAVHQGLPNVALFDSDGRCQYVVSGVRRSQNTGGTKRPSKMQELDVILSQSLEPRVSVRTGDLLLSFWLTAGPLVLSGSMNLYNNKCKNSRRVKTMLRTSRPIVFPNNLVDRNGFGEVTMTVVSVSQNVVDLLRQYAPALCSVPFDMS